VPVTHRVSWLPEAIDDLVRIREAVSKLTEHPMIGCPVLDITHPVLRDLFLAFGQSGYWLRYTVTNDAIIIVRIWHERENKEITSSEF
jgi:plasmid stabilization system protein ParE